MVTISSIDVNLTKIDERQMTLIDVNWLQNFWRVSDDALWRWWRFLTFCDVLWRFLTISIFKKIWKKIFDDFWRFYDVFWRCRQFWYRHLTSNDVNWRQLSSKLVFDVNWRHLTSNLKLILFYDDFWRHLTLFDIIYRTCQKSSKFVKI